MQIVLSKLAAQDIKDILQYTFEQWGEEQADKYKTILSEALQHLQDNPHFGRLREDLRPGCRTYRVEQHIIFYTVRGKAITIARVLHGKMDAKRHI